MSMPPPPHDSDSKLETTLSVRAVILSFVLTVIFSLLGWRLVNLHVNQGDTFRQAAREIFQREVVVPAARGALMDTQGEVLAIDRRSYSVIVDRNLLADRNLALRSVSAELGQRVTEVERHYTLEQARQLSVDRCLSLLAPRLGLGAAALHGLVGDSARGEVVVAKELRDEEAQALKDFIEAESLPGVFVREGLRRFHPMPDLAVHVLGFTNNENTGVEGIEKSMDSILRGVPGHQWFERTSKGGERLSSTRPPQAPQPGRSLRLTLDHQIQRLLEEELDVVGDDPADVYVPLLKAKGVSVVLMDPATNSILAMASRPHHNLADRGKLTPNLAVSETFEPGSTFKIGAYIGVLDEQLVGLATPLNLHGGRYEKGEIRIRDDHPVEGATVLTAFSHSSNIAAYKLASQLGAVRYHGYLRSLGFGARTGVPLPNEATGLLRPVEKWGTLSMRSLSFGYEVNVTPLQLLNAFSAVINGGMMREPRLVEAVLDQDGVVLEDRPPVELHRVCSEAAARQLRTAMYEVVKKGTAKQAAIPGFLVGGKTGTAQKYVPARKAYADGAYIVTFVGFAESMAGIELMGVVVVDDADVPANKEYGGHLSAPLFRRIAGKILAHRGVEPNPEWMPKNSTLAVDR
jgi:cell division protein FtsI/penicillin-binding protein 2